VQGWVLPYLISWIETQGFDTASIRKLSVAHSAPLDASEHRRFFRCPVRFGAGSTSMILSVSDAARPDAGG
jgi:hypothetical protein